jgi:translation initiation factor 1 (eIF-1/SUI1)
MALNVDALEICRQQRTYRGLLTAIHGLPKIGISQLELADAL